ncbi:hypothetical protein ASPBRDRAFT_448337 [Aspergillus brasiliensis CBS 101740]|uniref:Uncharacterized protein n=1 Tax=Aspergillus brasiliensis (strain CBS 101740 / IMI 381727 / IBT 21946) TaxID=767769 RepID=A0A1L9US06_ASPBC|nr:hypothetical protein ASPBRDRAFT_448337 [Aspergillus brasiliensis CBS 101740]
MAPCQHSKHIDGLHSQPFEKPAIDACRIVSERPSIVAILLMTRDAIMAHYSVFPFHLFVVCHPCLEDDHLHPPDGLPCRRRRPGEDHLFSQIAEDLLES